MGGRKGYSLRKIVGDLRKVKKEQKELFEGIDEKDPKKVVRASAKILAKSDKEITSLVYSLKFIKNLEKEEERLKKEEIKERRKELSKRWAAFRKKEKEKFDPSTNRRVVDSINDVLEGEK